MTKFAFTLTFNLLSLVAFAQTVEVKGNLKDAEGNPLPGASIVIKGTAKGTIADIDGNYTIKAPVGSTLVVSYIGYLPMEFEVTNTGKAKIIKKQKKLSVRAPVPNEPENINSYYKPKMAYLNNTDTNGMEHDPNNGIATMSPRMKYRIKSFNSSLSHIKFKGIRKNGKNDYLLFKGYKEKIYYIPKVWYSSSWDITRINDLPKLQNTYAQGQPVNGELQWMGPESESLFAWGPALSQLEYDGSQYPYHKNGRLVPLFAGNGQYAKSYDPYSFFQNGFQFSNRIKVKHRIGKVEYFAAFRNNHHTDIIPLSKFVRNTLNSGFTADLSKFSLEGNFTLSDVKSKHTSGNMLTYYTMKSVLLTPPSFDNTNDIGNKAKNNSEAYSIPSGVQRSAAINQTDNPYWLVNNTKDQLNSRMALGSLKFTYGLFNNARLNIQTHTDQQIKQHNVSISNKSYIFPEGRFYLKNSNLSSYGSNISLDNLEYNFSFLQITGQVQYQFSKEKAWIDRQDITAYPIPVENEGLAYNINNTRFTNRTNAKIQLNYDGVFLLTGNGHQIFFSDISKEHDFKGGSVSGGIILTNIYKLHRKLELLDFLKIYGSYGNDYKSPPLISDAMQYSSVFIGAIELNDFFPVHEIIYDQSLMPENMHTLNIGLNMQIFRNKLCFTANWFNKETTNAIFPDYRPDNIIGLNNLGELRSRGLEFSTSVNFNSRGFRFRNELNLTTGQTLVTDLYDGLESIPLAGFEFASSNAVKGKPLGVLVGSAFQRDASGNILIDESGYPLVGAERIILGNPAPNWTAGMANTIANGYFVFSVTWEMKYGGQIWNGTKATLDYYGLSETTAEQRNTRDYIFTGNTSDGNPNTHRIDFANPKNNLEANRWVRYGRTGVAEDYIEDASCLRIQRLSAGYTFKHIHLWSLNEIKIALHISNLILYKKYSGVDPESALFGEPGGCGLDYFNKPSNKSFGLTIEINL